MLHQNLLLFFGSGISERVAYFHPTFSGMLAGCCAVHRYISKGMAGLILDVVQIIVEWK